MGADRKQLSDGGIVCWLRSEELRVFVIDGRAGYGRMLAFFEGALEDLDRYGKATRRLTDLSGAQAVQELGQRPRGSRLIREVVIRSEAARTESAFEADGDRVTCALDRDGLASLVEATRLQTEEKQFFHGSTTPWGLCYAIDWEAAE